MLKYDLILMDADNTIYDFDASERNAIRETLVVAGITAPDAAQVYSEYNKQCWRAFEKGLMDQPTIRIRRFEMLFEHYRCQADVASVARFYTDALARQCIPYPGIEPVLRTITKHLPVVVLTNGLSSVQHSRFDASPLSPMLSGMLVSEEVGAPKPDPRMFRLALEQHGVSDPRRALMIGDSLTSDILGANRAGVDACWFNPERKPLTGDVHVEYEIHRVEEMPLIALTEA